MAAEPATALAWTDHLPALVVAAPLLGAPVCVLLRRRVFARWFSVAIVWACLAMSLVLLREVRSAGDALVYWMGGWRPPLGIEYRVGVASAFLLVVVTSLASVILTFEARGGVSRAREARRHLYYATFLLCIAGLLGMVITNDAFNIFVFLEISSLSSYILISMGKHRRALMSAFSYLIMGTIGGTFFLIGLALLYQLTGTLNMTDLAARIPATLPNRGVSTSLGLIGIGLMIKLAVFPLHHWLPNAYSFAPAKVSAFLAATSTKVSFFILARFFLTVFGATFVFTELGLHYLVVPLAIGAMFTGSIAAIYQTDLRRLLAYSSVAQLGYMVLGLSMANVTGLTGSLVHLFNHALMKGGLFLCVACLLYRLGTAHVDALEGLGRRMPWTMGGIVIGGLSLIGVPGTVGFVSKWYLVLGAIERGWLWVAALILISSLLAVIYIWRIVEIAYFKPREATRAEVREVPAYMLLPALLLIGLTIYFGLAANVTASIAGEAARELLGALP